MRGFSFTINSAMRYLQLDSREVSSDEIPVD